MKLKNFVGAIAGLAFSMILSTAVFAAPSFEIGAPIDTETKTEVTQLEKDKVVAVPIDVFTDNSSDVVANFNITVYYDKNILEPVAVKKSVYSAFGDTAATPIGSLSGNYAVNSLYNEDDEESFGLYNYTNDTDIGMVAIVATSVKHPLSYSVNGNRVGYFFFKVISEDATLNAELVKLNTAAKCYIKIGTADDVEMSSTYAKVNACAGAFNIKIDSTELKQFVHGVSIKVDGGEEFALDACKEDGTTYILPVRLTSATKTSGTASVQVILKVADTDTVGATTTDLVVKTPISVTLGAPTSYADSVVTTE